MVKFDREIRHLTITDFDRDGRNDIAVVNNLKAKIEILLQKESVGPEETTVTVDPDDFDINRITPPTRFKNQSVPVSQRIFSFVCGDLNSDGLPDLAFYGEPKGLYVILQQAPEGQADNKKTLTWRTRRKIEIDDGLLNYDALLCRDLNNDGADDLALAGKNLVYLILQEPDGSLAEPVKYPTTADILGLRSGDLNSDGINDLVMVTNDTEKPLHLRFGLKTGQLGPQQRFFIEKPHSMELCNIDGEGGDEILTVDMVSGRLTCYLLTPEKQKDGDWPVLFYPLSLGKESTKRDLVVADFDGDGREDVVVSEPGAAELAFYRQIPTLGLAEPEKFPAFADITSLSVADVDNNGKGEIAILSVKEKVIGVSRYENDRLTFPKPLELTGEPVAMDLADMDAEGSIDCAYISRDPNDVRSLRVMYGSRKKSKRKSDLAAVLAAWKVGESSPLELKKLSSNPEGMKILDVDQDGLQDVLIFVKYESPILVRQTQDGTFEIVDTPQAQASLIKEAHLHSIAVADLDQKPGKELLLAQENFGRSLVFAEGKSWTIVDQYNADSPENKISCVAAFDIDRHHHRPAILLLDGQKGRLQILKASDDKTYRLDKELDVGEWSIATHLKMLFAPLTGGDSRTILLFDSEKFALVVPPGRNNRPLHLQQHFNYETKIRDGSYGNVTAGDINTDDRVDIVMVEYKRNHIEIIALNPQFKPLPAMRFKVFEQKSYRDRPDTRARVSIEPREIRIGDVTGDDKADLVTIIHDRIIVYPQD